MNMAAVYVSIGVCLLLLMLPMLYRVVIGPRTIDRLIGANIIGTKTTILLLIVGALYDAIDMFVDLAITYALLNFLASLAAAHLLERWCSIRR